MSLSGTKTKMLSGINLLADTVKQTLGTKGRLIMYLKYRDFDDPVGYPVLTKDGVTVAEQIKSEDPVENMAIDVVREASKNTVSTSGDGTTTTCILAQNIITEGFKVINENYSSWQFNKDADRAVTDIVNKIKEYSKDVDGNMELLKNVAASSANDKEAGNMICDIIQEIGFYGDIQLKKTENPITTIDVVTGMKIHRGYFSQFFCSDQTSLTWDKTEVNILIYDALIRDYQNIAPYIRASVDASGNPVPILIYCQGVEDMALNRIKKGMEYNPFPMMIVEHDGFGERRENILEDLAIVVDGTIVDDTTDSRFASQYFGKAREVNVSKNFTSILNGKGIEKEIDQQVEMIEKLLNESNPSKNEAAFLRKRIANLKGGIAVINVGGHTRPEMNETYARIDDAVLAVKAAIKSGVCTGGAYVWSNVYNDIISSSNSELDRKINKGYYVVLDSINSILDQLLENAGEKYKVNQIREAIVSEKKAYNLIDSKLYDTNDFNIYDACSVLTDSITNATSVAKSILSTERIIKDGQVFA